MPIEQVQVLLGHSQIDTTLRYAMVNQNNVKASHHKYIGWFKSKFVEMFGDLSQYKVAPFESTTIYFEDGDWIETKDQSDKGIRLLQVGNIGNGFYVDKLKSAKYISLETFDRLHCKEVLTFAITRWKSLYYTIGSISYDNRCRLYYCKVQYKNIK